MKNYSMKEAMGSARNGYGTGYGLIYAEDGPTALQNTLIKLSGRKLGYVSPETEQKIREIESVARLEGILESIFEFDNEDDLILALH